MIGTRYPSEKRTYIDEKTGNLVTQLTQNGINFHLYFTDNSFDPTCENIYFMSNRSNPGTEIVQLFRMNLASGEMIQLTDDESRREEWRRVTTAAIWHMSPEES